MMDDLFQRRIMDLIKAAYNKNYVAFTDFCDLNEQNIIHSLPGSALTGVKVFFFGGCSTSERQMAAFVPDAFSYMEMEEIISEFPINVLHITPLSGKFTEKLTHRDYLGAVMSLGLERSVFGDLILSDNEAFVFVKKQLAPYVSEELSSVKHTLVRVTVLESSDAVFPEQKYEKITAGVASVRLDAVVSSGFKLSRGKAQSAVEGGLVFVNGRQITSSSFVPKEKAVITLRGTGRLVFDSIVSTTKKGRYMLELLKFI